MKSQSGFTHILIVVLLAVIAVGIGYIALNVNNERLSSVLPLPKDNLLTSSPKATIQPFTGTPEYNTIYLGTYEGKNALYVTNPTFTYIENDVRMTDSLHGILLEEEGWGRSPFEFEQLQNPIEVWRNAYPGYKVESLGKFLIDKAENNIVVDVYLSEINLEPNDYPWPLQKFVAIDLSTGESVELWEHSVPSEKYGEARGAAILNVTSPDKEYVALDVYNCYACEGTYAGTVIVNTETKEELYLEQIGNVTFQIDEGTFSYQAREPFKEWCGEGMGCEADGYRTVMKPAGKVYVEQLP